MYLLEMAHSSFCFTAPASRSWACGPRANDWPCTGAAGLGRGSAPRRPSAPRPAAGPSSKSPLATPGGAHAPTPTATRARTSSDASKWSSASSSATATRAPALAPGSAASVSAAWPAPPTVRWSFPRPADRRSAAAGVPFRPFAPNPRERSGARTGAKAGRPVGAHAASGHSEHAHDPR